MASSSSGVSRGEGSQGVQGILPAGKSLEQTTTIEKCRAVKVFAAQHKSPNEADLSQFARTFKVEVPKEGTLTERFHKLQVEVRVKIFHELSHESLSDEEVKELLSLIAYTMRWATPESCSKTDMQQMVSFFLKYENMIKSDILDERLKDVNNAYGSDLVDTARAPARKTVAIYRELFVATSQKKDSDVKRIAAELGVKTVGDINTVFLGAVVKIFRESHFRKTGEVLNEEASALRPLCQSYLEGIAEGQISVSDLNRSDVIDMLDYLLETDKKGGVYEPLQHGKDQPMKFDDENLLDKLAMKFKVNLTSKQGDIRGKIIELKRFLGNDVEIEMQEIKKSKPT